MFARRRSINCGADCRKGPARADFAQGEIRGGSWAGGRRPALPSGNNRNRGRTQASYAKCREHGVFLTTVVEAFHNKPNAACELLR